MTASAVAAPLAGAELTGSTLTDWGWAAALGGGAAYLASSAHRGPLLFAAGVAVVTASSEVSVATALLAVIAAALSTRHLRRRAVLARGLAGGAAMVSLLAASTHRPAPLTVLAAVGVAGPIIVSSVRGTDPTPRRRLVRTAIGAGIFALLAGGAAGIGLATSARDVDAGATSFRLGLAAARQGEVEQASAHLIRAEASVQSARRSMDRWGAAARLLPGAAQHIGAISDVLRDVDAVAGQASRTAALAESAQLSMRTGRIDVDAIGDLTNPFKRLTDALEEVTEEAEHHLRQPLLGVLDRRLRVIRDEADHARQDARLAEHAARVAPDMLGQDEPRRYLILFTSPSEARGRFGFPGSYAEVTFEDGRLRLGDHGTTSSDLVGLGGDQGAFDLTDDLLRPYLPFGTTRLMLNVTIPPDFPTVASVAARLWESSGRPPLDGVVRFDPASLAALLRYTGAVQVEDVAEPLTPENLERFLVFDQYVQFPNEQAPRREVLETVAEVTSERLQTVDLPQPRALVDTFGPLARADRFHVAAFAEAEDRLLRAVGLDGRLPRVRSDSLLVTNVNSGGNKIDAFLRRSIDYAVEVRDQELVGALRVRLENTAPSSGLPFYVIGSSTRPPLPRGTNRTTLLVLAHGRADAVLVDGRPVPARVEHTGGQWLHQVTLDIPPKGVVEVELELEANAPSGEYSLWIEPGGGVEPDRYEVDITTDDGREITHRGRLETATSLR